MPPADDRPATALRRPANCTFSPSDWDILAEHWFPIAVSEAVGDSPHAATLLDVDLLLFRSEGRVVVARDLCPHRGMLLSKGWVSDGQIVCPYHGLHFAGDGHCTLVPADPAASIPPRLALTVLPAVEKFGLIWTSLHSKQPRLPDFEAWDNADFQPIVPPTIDIAGSVGRQMEGFLDVAHFAWAHSGSFGQRDNAVVPDYRIRRTDRGFCATYNSSVSNYPPSRRHMAPDNFVWSRVFDVFLPFAARLVVHFPGAARLWILNAPSPVSARKTRLFSPIARNFDKERPVAEVHAFNLQVFEEDRVMVEAQRPEDLPLDLSAEFHIAADRSSVSYRRLLSRMGLSLAYTS